jgi:hypothetical protein
MTQSASPSSQTDTLVSVRLDGLIHILQGLRLEDRSAIAAALLADSGQHVSEGESAVFFNLSSLTSLLQCCRSRC